MAVRDVAGIKTIASSRFADNATGQISAGDSSDTFSDVADSFLNITDHLLDEDDMASDSATKVPSQQSVKAYVDAQVADNAVNNTDVKYFEQFDWIGNADVTLKTPPMGWLILTSGTGANWSYSTYGANSTEKAFGSIQLTTGSTTSGLTTLMKGIASISFAIGNTIKLRMRSALETLSDATDEYRVWMGFGSSQTAVANSFGAFFRYNHNTNSGKWEAVTADGTETTSDTGIAGDLLYHIFEIRVNSDATIITFYIDGNLVATHTTASGHNIPDAGDLMGLQFKISKVAGTTTRNIHMDWYDFLMTRTTAR